MRTRIGYKSFVWSTDTNFNGADVPAQQGPGKFNFDNLEQQAQACGLGGLVCPVFSVSFFTEVERTFVNLYLRNPLDTDVRKVLFRRSVAEGDDPVFSFVEDNLGEGWPVPYLSGNAGRRLELILETLTATDGEPADALVEIWYEPTPNLTVYKAMIEAQYGLQPGVG